jgi:hypothetical protein
MAILYKSPIRVVCINPKNSTKLIKGATYLASSIHSWNKKRTVYLQDVGSYGIANFTLLDGRSLDSEPDFSIERKSLDNEKNYTGQFVKCKYSSGKSLKEGEIYYVEKEKREPRANGRWTDLKLKIRGIRNYVSPYRFEEIDIKEQRNIKLKNLKGDKIKTGEQTRKFLLYTEKQKITILFETLAKVMTDLSKIEIETEIDIVGLMVIKGRKYNISSEDIRPFLKNKIETILKPFKLVKV